MAKINHGSDPNVRHSRYNIVESRIVCPSCSKVSAVFAFALPAGYESLSAVDDEPDDASEIWEKTDFAAVLSYVEYLSQAVIDQIRAVTTHYRLDSDSEGGGRFWRNHCEHVRRTSKKSCSMAISMVHSVHWARNSRGRSDGIRFVNRSKRGPVESHKT